jgi:hypothetical protein
MIFIKSMYILDIFFIVHVLNVIQYYLEIS